MQRGTPIACATRLIARSPHREIVSVDLARPRDRIALAEDRPYVHYRAAVLEFLDRRPAVVERRAA